MDSLLNYIKNKSNRKNLIAVAVMLLALPVGLILLRSQQIFNPRASADPIVFTGPNVEVIDGRRVLTKPEVTLQITSKLGAPAPTAIPASSQSPTPTPAATSVSSPTPAASPVLGAEGAPCRPEVEICGANLKCAQAKPSAPSNSVAGKCVKNDSPTAAYAFDKTGITENSAFNITISSLEPTGRDFANVALRIDSQYFYLGGPASGPYTYSSQGLSVGDHEIQLLAHCEYKENAPPDCSKADVKFNTISFAVLRITTSLPEQLMNFIGSISPVSIDLGVVQEVAAQQDIRERCTDRISAQCETASGKAGTMFFYGGVIHDGQCVRDNSVSTSDNICYENLTVIGGQPPSQSGGGGYTTPASGATVDLSQSVANCKGENKTYQQLKDELLRLGYTSGPLDVPSVILIEYNRTACPNGNPNTNKIMTCNGPKTVAEMQAELRAAGGGEVDSSRVQDVYNRTTCKGGSLNANGTVTTCKGETISMAQFDEELRKSGYNVQNPTINDKLEGYRQAACPIGPPSLAVQTCKTPLNLGGPTNVGELMRDVRAANFPDQGFRNTTLQQAIIAYNNAQVVCRSTAATSAPTPRATLASTPSPTPVAGLCSSPRDFSKVARGLVVQNPMSSDQILAKVCADSGQDVASCRIQVVSHYKGFDSEDPNNQLYNTEVISANGKFWVLGKVGSATGTSGFAGTSKRLVATGNNEDLEDFNQICKFRPNQSGRCILDNISHFKGFDTDDKKSLLYNTEFISGYGKFVVLSDINIESRLRAEGVNITQALANLRKLNNGRYVVIEGNLSDAFPAQCQGRTTDCKLDVVQHYRDFDSADAQSNLYNTEFISAYGKYWVLSKANQQGQRTVVSTGDLKEVAEFAAMCSCGTGACALDEVSHFKGFDNDSDNVEYAGGVGWYWVLKSLQTPSTPNPTPTPTPTSSPTPKPAVYTTSVKVAETREALAGATAIPYTKEPLLINYEFQNTDPGQKFIFVEYTASDGTKSIESAQIDLIDKAPVITSVSCVADLQNPNNVKFTIKGERFGTSGSVKVGSRSLNLDGSWSSTEVKANLSDSGLVVASATPTPTPTATPRATGTASPTPAPTVTPSPTPASSAAIGIIRRDGTTEYNLTLTRSDGRTVSEKCTVGQTQLSLGAQLFCREPNSFALNDVDMVLVRLDENGSKTSDRITQKVTVDPNGYIRLNRNLQDGQMYEVSLKAPRSVRRVAKFTAAGNTNSITNFILPVGDVAPLPNGDGAINTLDRAELNNEWKVSSPSATLQPADFNKDFRVNSVDWACMRYDFGSTNQSEP